jgi:hypothetical protein
MKNTESIGWLCDWFTFSAWLRSRDDEPIEVDDDVSHEASENKEQGKFQSRWASLYTLLTYDMIMRLVYFFCLITFAGWNKN